MRRVLIAAACGIMSLTTIPAWADGGLGGGLFEMLVTGGNPRPTTYSPRVQQPGALGAQYIAPEVVYGDPFDQSAPKQMASIAPQEPTAVSREIPAQFKRQEVAYDGRERPGTIVIDTSEKFLFYVEPDGKAMRYGIGVGRPGFEWSGVKTITRKAEWPDWTPPPEMLLRRPELPRHMDGGPENPLGARALYLGSSMYRIHGTNEPWTIGQNVSSGCIRMMNEDVEDLYERAKIGTRVIVM
jgi:lipoprotein-anchoring transpeptidase ErfK/SrfK